MARDRKFAAILAWVRWVRRGRGKWVTSPFSLSLPKPFPSLNPRWRSLDQNALARVFARQNTHALQANMAGDLWD